ncbi:unnamed protein product [Cylicocyclus nassatus]|uniref:Saposin B-type domain-containing protein n=1 Tax=Cylicocyclus nassatus TaxID=53992 RepID=A0AA36GJQ6_CYLNA|nr:unnamed protein product [Cylicocyclus nassatus]
MFLLFVLLILSSTLNASEISELCSYIRNVNGAIQHAQNFCKASEDCETMSAFFLDIMEQMSRRALEYQCTHF